MASQMTAKERGRAAAKLRLASRSPRMQRRVKQKMLQLVRENDAQSPKQRPRISMLEEDPPILQQAKQRPGISTLEEGQLTLQQGRDEGGTPSPPRITRTAPLPQLQDGNTETLEMPLLKLSGNSPTGRGRGRRGRGCGRVAPAPSVDPTASNTDIGESLRGRRRAWGNVGQRGDGRTGSQGRRKGN